MKFTNLSIEQRMTILTQVNGRTNQDYQTIEKDWWVTQVLKAIFSLPYAEHLSFKGGTSLSKAWHLIDRFSEDIDIAISRDFLGYGGELSRTQISDKLRRAACSFVREKMQQDLHEQLIKQGLKDDDLIMHVNITPISTTDPETILIDYRSILPQSDYISHTVKVEISGRSMDEPLRLMPLQSLVDEYLPQAAVVEPAFQVSVVLPERTCLEKIFLLHEEFVKPSKDIRTSHMSRHLYDINAMIGAGIADRAIHDERLFRSVIEHRRKFINLRDFNYDDLYPATLTILPPADVADLWQKDYNTMRQTMIYGPAPTYDELTSNIEKLQITIRTLTYKS